MQETAVLNILEILKLILLYLELMQFIVYSLHHQYRCHTAVGTLYVVRSKTTNYTH